MFATSEPPFSSARAAQFTNAAVAAFVFSVLFSALMHSPSHAATPPTTATPVGAATPTVPAPPVKSFVTIGDKPAVLYDAPSPKSNKNFIIQRFTPLEVLVKLDKMTKVRDAENSIGWIENSALGERRHVQVSANLAEVRSATSATATLTFEVQRAVLLEVTGPAIDGWLPIKHRDGQTGFVKLDQVWGD